MDQIRNETQYSSSLGKKHQTTHLIRNQQRSSSSGEKASRKHKTGMKRGIKFLYLCWYANNWHILKKIICTFNCCKMPFFRVCDVRQDFYVFSHYRNPDLGDRIFLLWLLMAAVQAEDVRASFLYVGDLNGHHQEWLGSTNMNRHGVAAIDIATVSGYDQLVVGPTHACGGILDFLMTDVHDLVRVAVVSSMGNESLLSVAVISMARAVPNLCVR